MTCDPTDIGHASKFVTGMNVEDKLDGKSSTKQVSTSSVNDTLGFASRTRSLRIVETIIREAEETHVHRE